jgi:class 3 adenylate cyclase
VTEVRFARRVLATVLFTDIVGSTERAASLGDSRWRDLLESHHAAVRVELQRSRGREIDTAGDGFLAVFDGPARAIRAGEAIIGALARLGLAVRAGVHTGEVELLPQGQVGGIVVHIGARIASRRGRGRSSSRRLCVISSRDRVSYSRIEGRTPSRASRKTVGCSPWLDEDQTWRPPPAHDLALRSGSGWSPR